jgi:hypothetical protein
MANLLDYIVPVFDVVNYQYVWRDGTRIDAEVYHESVRIKRHQAEMDRYDKLAEAKYTAFLATEELEKLARKPFLVICHTSPNSRMLKRMGRSR